MALDFTQIEAAVTKVDTVKDSVVALLQQIGQVLLDNAGNQTKINEFANSLIEDADTMASAVLANTPPAPPVP
jgi:hypothetical protein